MNVRIACIVTALLFAFRSGSAQAVERGPAHPLPSFEKNAGQFDSSVRFALRTGTRSIFLTATEVIVSSADGVMSRTQVSGTPVPRIVARDRVSTTSNYIRGNDPARWQTDVPHYRRIEYEDVRPGVDLVVEATREGVHYAFVAGPRAEASGNPVSAMMKEPRVVVGYMTYLGGLGTDVGNGIAVDEEGSAYVIGRTESDDFPTAGALQTVRKAGRDIFISKLSPDGSELEYSTYIGGTGDDNPLEVVVDEHGQAFIAGVTSSIDFPTVRAFQQSYGGGAQDGFVLKLAADGRSLLYATYLGGTGLNQVRGIAVDRDGSAYVTGNSPNDGYPTKNPIQPYGGGVSDAFITKISPDGDALQYSTFIGGNLLESGRGIRVDQEGNAYIAGETRSLNFPATSNAFQKTYGGGLDDLFVLKLNAPGTALVYATYLGGDDSDQGQSTIGTSSTIHGRIIAIDDDGSAYITGDTASRNFPTKNALWPAFAGGAQDAFAAKLTPDGTALVYSTYFGGSGFDTARSITVDRSGQAVFAGGTSSLDLPVEAAWQAVYGGGDFDGFIVSLSAAGDRAVYATYVGGSGTDVVWDVTVGKKAKRAFVTGQTSSADFAVGGKAQMTLGGGFDAFVGSLVMKGPGKDGSRDRREVHDHL